MVLAMSTTGWVIVGILAVCIWVALAFWPARVAGRKGHSFMGFFLLSLLFFPLAIILAYMADDRTGVLASSRANDRTMIWALLAFVGVPLGCAPGIFMLLYRNRGLRHRPGNVPVRRHLPGKRRWSRGHGVWVSDVFAFRGSPAAWQESLLDAKSVTLPRANRK